jgi:hypothetical protein
MRNLKLHTQKNASNQQERVFAPETSCSNCRPMRGRLGDGTGASVRSEALTKSTSASNLEGDGLCLNGDRVDAAVDALTLAGVELDDDDLGAGDCADNCRDGMAAAADNAISLGDDVPFNIGDGPSNGERPETNGADKPTSRGELVLGGK